MTNKNEIYKCNVCGNIVEVLHASTGQLVCCNQPMQLLQENVVDASKEKHVPVIEKIASGIRVKVGAVQHPMEEKHYIEFIEVISGDMVYKKFLKPGDKPEAEFELKTDIVVAREYCNLHGLWKA